MSVLDRKRGETRPSSPRSESPSLDVQGSLSMKTLHFPRHPKVVVLVTLGFGLTAALAGQARACSAGPYIGEVCVFAGNTCPAHYVPANGSLIDIEQNLNLFNVLSTTYGGDGSTTFALPNLNGRSVIGTNSPAGNSLPSVQLGQAVGASSVLLTSDNLPAHSHEIPQLTPSPFSQPPAYLQVQTNAVVITPTLVPSQTYYLTNASAGSGPSSLKGLYTTTAPGPGATAQFWASVVMKTTSVSGTAALTSPGYTQISTQAPAVGLTYCIAVTGTMPPTSPPSPPSP